MRRTIGRSRRQSANTRLSAVPLALALLAGLPACEQTGAPGSPEDSPVLDSGATDSSAPSDGPWSDAPTDRADTAIPATQEVCNFADDDGDGEVDEGFAWRPSQWKHLLTTTRFAAISSPLVIDAESIGLAGFDEYGEPGDKAFAGLWSAGGTAAAPPSWVSVPFSSNGNPSFSRLGDDRLLLLFGSTDWKGCPNGCPVTATELSAKDASSLKKSTWNLPPLRGDEALSLICPTAAQCLLLAQGGAVSHPLLMSIAPQDGTIDWQTSIDTARNAVFSMHGGRAYVLEDVAAADGGDDTRVLQVYGLDGKAEGQARVVGLAVSSVFGLKCETHACFTEIAGPDGPAAPPLLAKIPDDASAPVVSTELAASKDLHGLVQIADTLVLINRTGLAGGQVRRLKSDLSPFGAPAEPIFVDGSYAASSHLVWTGKQLLILQSNYDGRSIDMIGLECSP